MIYELKKYQINLFGDSYSIISDESQEEINKTVALIDSLAKEALQKSGISDMKKISALVALKLANRISKAEVELGKIKEEEIRLMNLLNKALN